MRSAAPAVCVSRSPSLTPGPGSGSARRMCFRKRPGSAQIDVITPPTSAFTPSSLPLSRGDRPSHSISRFSPPMGVKERGKQRSPSGGQSVERKGGLNPPSEPPSAGTAKYTGPDPSESPMSRYDRNQPTRNHRNNPCCFCWCCCCSCSWNEDRNRLRRLSRDTKLESVPHCEVCSKPSSEEVLSWAGSFEKLMKNPAGRNVFREFLRTEYSEENMLFWLACEELKKDHGKHGVEEKARMIYEDYISILSPKEVSLDSRVREVINRRMAEPSCHTFDDAQLQIYTLMHRDSYPRFLNSAIYRSLLQSISRSSSES